MPFFSFTALWWKELEFLKVFWAFCSISAFTECYQTGMGQKSQLWSIKSIDQCMNFSFCGILTDFRSGWTCTSRQEIWGEWGCRKLKLCALVVNDLYYVCGKFPPTRTVSGVKGLAGKEVVRSKKLKLHLNLFFTVTSLASSTRADVPFLFFNWKLLMQLHDGRRLLEAQQLTSQVYKTKKGGMGSLYIVAEVYFSRVNIHCLC